MRKLIVLSFITLDGVMQAPGGPEEDVSGDFTEGGWSFGYWDDVINNAMSKQMNPPFDLLLGRKTYEIFSAYWPKVKDEESMGLNNAKKYVVSTTLKNPEWKNTVIINKDIVESLRNLKKENGPEIQVHGSGNLIQTLLNNDLVDELKLKIYPLTIGKGKRLFAERTIAAGFNLTESIVSKSGVIIASYKREGTIKKGSFAL